MSVQSALIAAKTTTLRELRDTLLLLDQMAEMGPIVAELLG